MTENNQLDILKHAILLEKRGKAFYRTAASQSTNSDVKAFFETMAQEEVQHVKILSDQFKAFKETGQFTAPDTSEMGTISQNVLTPEVKARIAAADFEAAAISAAMLMEERAISLYAKRGNDGPGPGREKALSMAGQLGKGAPRVPRRHRCGTERTDLERQRVLAVLIKILLGTPHYQP
jgi:rubrerythrin